MTKASKELTRKREELAFELAATGMPERKIAEEIEKEGLGKVSQQAVNKMLRRCEDRFFKEMNERIAGIKASQTKALMVIHRESMEAWERSKQASKTLIKQVDAAAKAGPASAPAEKVTTQIKDQDGDPRYLDQARAALADVRKIWGADSPQKYQHSGDPDPNAKPINTEVDFSKATVDELRALRDIRRNLLDRSGRPACATNSPGLHLVPEWGRHQGSVPSEAAGPPARSDHSESRGVGGTPAGTAGAGIRGHRPGLPASAADR